MFGMKEWLVVNDEAVFNFNILLTLTILAVLGQVLRLPWAMPLLWVCPYHIGKPL